MAELHCASVETLRSLLSDAIIELCRREAFYVEELRIEGTVCVVSDRSSALIVQITEQVGNTTSDVTNELDKARNHQLPVVTATKLNFNPMMSSTGQSTAVKHYARRRLHSCRHCGAHFIRLGSLRSHVRRRHPLAVFSPRRRKVATSQIQQQPAVCSVGETGSSVNQKMVMSAMKSEPLSGETMNHGFPPDLNLSLQQMVRTLSMMSSLPISNNAHFPPAAFTMSAPASDDPVELRRSADGKFACPYCTKTYGFKHSLKEHIDVHRGRRPHICRHCGASFAHLASLCAHIRRRHDDRMPAEFRCSLCGEKLMNLQSLKQHRTWRHKDAPRLSDPLPPLLSDNTMSDHLPGGKKDGNLSHVERSPVAPWFLSSSASVDVQSKPLSSTATRPSDQRKESTTDLSTPFDGFDFHGFLPSVNDFPSVAVTSWSTVNSGHCHTSHKFFTDTVTAAAGQSQSKTPAASDLQYHQAGTIPDSYFMTAVCPGCSTKFRTETEYRRHVACNPDHVTLSWRQ